MPVPFDQLGKGPVVATNPSPNGEVPFDQLGSAPAPVATATPPPAAGPSLLGRIWDTVKKKTTDAEEWAADKIAGPTSDASTDAAKTATLSDLQQLQAHAPGGAFNAPPPPPAATPAPKPTPTLSDVANYALRQTGSRATVSEPGANDTLNPLQQAVYADSLRDRNAGLPEVPGMLATVAPGVAGVGSDIYHNVVGGESEGQRQSREAYEQATAGQSQEAGNMPRAKASARSLFEAPAFTAEDIERHLGTDFTPQQMSKALAAQDAVRAGQTTPDSLDPDTRHLYDKLEAGVQGIRSVLPTLFVASGMNIPTPVLEATTDFAGAMLSPENATMLAAMPEAKVLSSLFALQGIQGSYASATEALKAYESGDNDRAAKFATTAALNAAMAGMAGSHAIHGVVPGIAENFRGPGLEDLASQGLNEGAASAQGRGPEPPPPSGVNPPWLRPPVPRGSVATGTLIDTPAGPMPKPADYVAGHPMTPWEMEQQAIDDAANRSRDEHMEAQYQGQRGGFTVKDSRPLPDQLRGDNLSEVSPSDTTPARRILLPGGKELLIPTTADTASANRFVAPDVKEQAPPSTYDVPLAAGGGVLRMPWDKAPVGRDLDGTTRQMPVAPLVRPYEEAVSRPTPEMLHDALGVMGAQDALSNRIPLGLPEGEPSEQLAAMRAAKEKLGENPLAGPDVLRTAMGDDAKIVNKAARTNLPTFLKRTTAADELIIQRQTGLSPEDFWRGSRKSAMAERSGLLTETPFEHLGTSTPLAETVKPPVYAAPRVDAGAPLPNGAATQGVYGAETRLRTTQGDDLPARYKLVDLKDVKPSHSGITFAPREDYGLENDRHYESDLTERNKVIQNSTARTPDNPKGYDPTFTVNDNPDATNGPPIVTPSGQVLGGNSRAMTLERVYEAGRGDEYKNLLRERAASYGLNPGEVDQMERPVLVREVPQPTDRAHAQRLITDLNEVPTHTLNEDAASLSFGRKLSKDSLSMMAHLIDEVGDGSLPEVMRKKPNDLLHLLRRDGALTDAKLNSMMDVGKDGPEFTDAGKTFFKDALASRIIDDYDILREAPASAKDKVVAAIGNLLYLRDKGAPWDLSKAVSEAVRTITDARDHKITVPDLIQQTSFLSSDPRNVISDAVALKMDEGQNIFREAVKEFAKGAKHEEAGASMFSDTPQVDPATDFDLAFAPKGEDSYGLRPGDFEAARAKFDEPNPEMKEVGGKLPEQTETGGGEAAGSDSLTSNDVVKREVPKRLPAPDDVAGWEKLEDEGLAKYNFDTHSYEYTGPISRDEAGGSESAAGGVEAVDNTAGPGGLFDPNTLNMGVNPLPAFRAASRAWDEYVAKPIETRLVGKWVTKRPVLDRIDPELAAKLNVHDNIHHYSLAKAQGIIHDVLAPLYDEFGVTSKGKHVNDAYLDRDGNVIVRAKGFSDADVQRLGLQKLTPEEAFAHGRAKERLLVLMADSDSRENLRVNHPDEYAAASNDPAIQKALEIYRPAEQELTQQREALGGSVADGDYLRRVYDMFTSGIGKAKAATEGADPAFNALSRLVSAKDEAAPRFNQQRRADAEYYYQNGLHEFGPSFGPKYLGTTRRFSSNEVIDSFIEKATPRPADGVLPHSIEYGGDTYYRGDVAADLRDSGKDRKAKSYEVFDPQQGNLFHQADSPKYLAPTDVVKQLNGEMNMPDMSAGAFKRWMQDNALAFGFGIPHGFNLMRRLGQVTNWNPAKGIEALFGSEMRQRAANVLADEVGNSLAARGAIRAGDEGKIAGYIEGNLNPMNWQDSYLRNSMKVGGKTSAETTIASAALSPLKIAGDIVSRINSLGHKALFDPESFGGWGGLDQRVRLAAADYLTEKFPEKTPTEIASTINKAFGDYQRANWSNQQKVLSNFLFFPGFETSTFQWVLDHPIKTAGSGALATLLINRAVHALGGNEDDEKNDLSSVHIGNRTLHSGIFTEGMAMHLAAPILAGLRSYVLDDEGAHRAAGEAAGKVPEMARAFTDPVMPIYRLAFDLAENKNLGRDTTKPEDKYLPGVLGNKAADEYATQVANSLLPEFSRVSGANNKNGIDAMSLVGGAMGVTNREVTPEDKIKAAYGKSIVASKVFNEVLAKQGDAGGRKMLQDDPDTIVYAAFEPALAAESKQIKEWDKAAEVIQQQLSGDERKTAMQQLSAARAEDAKRSLDITRQMQQAIQKVHEHRAALAVPGGV